MNSSQINEAAAAWVIAHDRGLSAAEQDAFSEWLAADPRHKAAFAMQDRAWREFDLLEQWRPRHSREPNPDILNGVLLKRIRRTRTWLRRGVEIAACVGLLALFGYAFMGRTPEAPAPVVATTGWEERRVSAGESRLVALPDGSEIDLNRDSELVVRFTPERRTVEVTRGEAFFTVAKDASRPFDVLAKGATVRAVGTQFGVRLADDHVAVVVAEGRVILGATDIVQHAVVGQELTGAVSLGSGDYSEWAVGTANLRATVRALPAAETSRLLEWKPEVLDFVSTPLAAVVGEFNKRNEVKIELVDESLASLPIVASFRSNNVAGFVALLEVTGVARARHVAPDRIELSAR
jgi:transmembrane sensor